MNVGNALCYNYAFGVWYVPCEGCHVTDVVRYLTSRDRNLGIAIPFMDYTHQYAALTQHKTL